MILIKYVIMYGYILFVLIWLNVSLYTPVISPVHIWLIPLVILVIVKRVNYKFACWIEKPIFKKDR